MTAQMTVRGHAAHIVLERNEFPVQSFADGSFVPGDRFDIDKLPCERDDVHAERIT